MTAKQMYKHKHGAGKARIGASEKAISGLQCSSWASIWWAFSLFRRPREPAFVPSSTLDLKKEGGWNKLRSCVPLVSRFPQTSFSHCTTVKRRYILYSRIMIKEENHG